MTDTSDLNAERFIERMERGELPRDFTMFAAQGMLPLPQDELIAVLSHLVTIADLEISATARTSLSEVPSRAMAAFCNSSLADATSLDAIATTSSDLAILEAVVRSRAVSDETIDKLARLVKPSIQEIIIVNQERIIRSPGILDALLENPSITEDVRRRVLEVREEFFEKKARRASLAAELVEGLDFEDDIDIGPIADLLDKAETEPQPENTLPPPEGLAPDDAKLSAWSKIAKMNVAERVQCAYKGGKSERGILVRDRNRLVATAVVRSPRISESEIESFAAMRNLEDEVLRIIGRSREHTSKYPVAHALVKNPKTPATIALTLAGRLTSKDLKSLVGNKDVTEIIRRHAKKLLETKEKH